jgi:hypothetical protein
MRSAIAIVCALAAVSCQRNTVRAILPADVRIDVFPQVSRAQLDALFVVDNSKFMAVHQKRVADSFHRFVEYLARNQMDWHLGLVTSDVSASPAVYQGGGDRKYFSSGDSDVAQKVAQAVVALGNTGSAISAVLEQADLSLRGPPDGFLRAGAALFVMLVTDNNDPWSPGEDLYYYRALKQSKGAGNDGLVRMSAVAGPPPNGCTIPDPSNPQNTFVAQAAPRLQGLAEATGGRFHSLCGPYLGALGLQPGTPDAFGYVGSVRAPATLPPGTQVKLAVRFSPTPGTAAASGALQIDSSDPAHPRFLVPLSGSINRAPIAVARASVQGGPRSERSACSSTAEMALPVLPSATTA